MQPRSFLREQPTALCAPRTWDWMAGSVPTIGGAGGGEEWEINEGRGLSNSKILGLLFTARTMIINVFCFKLVDNTRVSMTTKMIPS